MVYVCVCGWLELEGQRGQRDGDLCVCVCVCEREVEHEGRVSGNAYTHMI